MKVDFALLTFNQIADREARDHSNAMPATFRLKADQVDALIAKFWTVLEHSPQFIGLLRRMKPPAVEH